MMKPGGLHGGEGTGLVGESEAPGSCHHQLAPWASVSLLLMLGSGQTLLTTSIWPLLPRCPRWVATSSWMGPGPSTSPGSRRTILASTPAGRRTRRGLPRRISISSSSVSEAGARTALKCVWPCSPYPLG